MSIAREVDFIIVGQGLAGSALALHLLKEGKRLRVYDLPNQNHCSTVAAGLFNPITGKIMTKTWLADQLYPYLTTFYSHWEKELNTRFFFPQKLYRPFLSIQEQNEWMAKSADPSLSDYIEEIFTQSRFVQSHDSFGGILLQRCGFVDVNKYLKSVRELLQSVHSFEETFFDSHALKVSGDHIQYGAVSAKAIIYCDGIASLKNSFFNWLPIRPLKGETLSVRFQQRPEAIFNRGVYIVPLSREGFDYKIGATYQASNPTEMITDAGKEELIEKLEALCTLPFTVINQEWGIRPTTSDRKPILGDHFEYKNVIIFNGLGTKGVSLAPYFANQLSQWLMGKGEIQKEVNIGRFKALYSKSLV